MFGRLIETKGTPPRFGFTFSVVLLIIPTDPRAMQRFIAPVGLLDSLVSGEAALQPPKKSLLTVNCEQRDLCR
jgi:hypothetical protein